MSVTVERLPNEPIIIATISGHVDGKTAREVFDRTAELAAVIEGHVYRITDCRTIDANLPDTLGMLKEAGRGIPGSTSDPRFTVVLVGGHDLTKFFASAMGQQQFGGVSVPVFESVEAALDYIRVELAED